MKPLSLVRLAPELASFRHEIRQFLDEMLVDYPPVEQAKSWMKFDADFSKALADKGWVGLMLPTQYGGAGLGFLERFVLVEELLNAGAPIGAHWVADRQTGPLIMKYGSEKQKQAYLPGICRGETFFCIGMSEPGSGSDLASIRSRAVPTGDSKWCLNGSKIWTTNAHLAHYMVALVRTSDGEGRHDGLSQVVVDLSLPGVTVQPIRDLTGDSHFSEVFFTDVILDEDALLGVEGRGWEQVNAELGFERSGPERIYSSMALVEQWLNYAPTLRLQEDGAALVGRIVSWLMIARGMSISIAHKLARGESPAVEAAVVKDFGVTIEQDIPRWIAGYLDAYPDKALPGSLLDTLYYVEQIAPSYSLRGGTREILRTIIARQLASTI